MRNKLLAGAYEVDITPPLGVNLAGYFNVRKADGILDNLYAKAVVLKDEVTELAVVSCDLCVIPKEMVTKIRSLASQWSGIKEENIMIVATHTHTGPVTTGLLAGEADPLYIDFLIRKVATAIAMAQKNLREARIKVGRVTEDTLVFNRRYVMKNGSVVTNPGKLNPDIVRPAGPVDPEIIVALIEDKVETPLAVLINYANHVDTIGGTAISADYPGVISKILHKSVGDIPVLFLPGAQGDINHIDVANPEPQGGYGEAERIGKILSEKILESLNDLSLIEPHLKTGNSTLKIPLRKPTEEDIHKAKLLLSSEETGSSSNELTAFDLAKGSLEVEKVYAQEIMALAQLDRDFEELELQAISVGELVFLGVPGELFVEIGLAIKKESPFNYTAVVSLANGGSGYIPTEKAFSEGGYEVRLARSSKLDKLAEKEIIREGKNLIESLRLQDRR